MVGMLLLLSIGRLSVCKFEAFGAEFLFIFYVSVGWVLKNE